MRRIYVKRLRGMCTVRPLSEFEARRHHGCLSRCGERRRVGDTSVQAPTLEIHRKQRLPTDTAEETETRLGACPSAVLESRIHALIYNVSTFHVLLYSIQFCYSHAWKKSTSLDMSCANKIKRNQPLSSRTHSNIPDTYSWVAPARQKC